MNNTDKNVALVAVLFGLICCGIIGGGVAYLAIIARGFSH